MHAENRHCTQNQHVCPGRTLHGKDCRSATFVHSDGPSLPTGSTLFSGVLNWKCKTPVEDVGFLYSDDFRCTFLCHPNDPPSIRTNNAPLRRKQVNRETKRDERDPAYGVESVTRINHSRSFTQLPGSALKLLLCCLVFTVLV